MRRGAPPWTALILALGGTAWAEASRGGELRVDPETALFAIVTQKAGALSGVAHDHLVVAAGWTVRAAGDAGEVQGATFEIELPVAQLVVDDPELQRTWSERLLALGLLTEPFAELSEKNRAKVRRAMLGAKQLDAERFPTIRARLTAIAERPAPVGEEVFPLTVELTLEAHGQTAERSLAARIEWQGETVQVEAAGAFAFTDFGIEPYSALLGALRNADPFHVYVRFQATP